MSDVVEHNVLADDYCMTCQRIPCQRAVAVADRKIKISQLDRIELNLRKIMRHLGIEVEGDDNEQPNGN